jgi:Zn-dependent peptidase ImmA (M78 family)
MPDKIENKVEELLRDFSIKRPPIAVDKIAKKLGVLLCPLPGDNDISGAIIRKDNRVVIAVNPTHHINRRRFTIAHELGHYFFHEGLEEHVDQNFRVAWRNTDSSRAINWLEVEANRFAACLLMPTTLLQSDLDTLQTLDARTIILLAKRYVVSPEAMKIRLSQFGITGPFD